MAILQAYECRNSKAIIQAGYYRILSSILLILTVLTRSYPKHRYYANHGTKWFYTNIASAISRDYKNISMILTVLIRSLLPEHRLTLNAYHINGPSNQLVLSFKLVDIFQAGCYLSSRVQSITRVAIIKAGYNLTSITIITGRIATTIADMRGQAGSWNYISRATCPGHSAQQLL